MKLNKGFITHNDGSEKLLVSTGASKFSGLVRSNETAGFIIHCLENETKKDYINLLDEMVEMGILGKPDENRDLYRLRRTSFVDIIGEDLDSLDADIVNNNEEA